MRGGQRNSSFFGVFSTFGRYKRISKFSFLFLKLKFGKPFHAQNFGKKCKKHQKMRNFVAPLIFFLMVDIKNRFSTFERYTYERLSKIFWKKYVHTNGTQKIKYVHTSGTKTAMWQKKIFGCRNFCRKIFSRIF